MSIDIGATERGFALGEFKDSKGIKCSIQKSSLAFEDNIWLGCDDANPLQLIPGEGWVPMVIPEAEATVYNTRMHLNQEQAAALIPLLQRFVDTGELYE